MRSGGSSGLGSGASGSKGSGRRRYDYDEDGDEDYDEDEDGHHSDDDDDASETGGRKSGRKRRRAFAVSDALAVLANPRRLLSALTGLGSSADGDGDEEDPDASRRRRRTAQARLARAAVALVAMCAIVGYGKYRASSPSAKTPEDAEAERPAYVFEHPYVSSSYYTSTKSMKTLRQTEVQQVIPNKKKAEREVATGGARMKRTRLAVLRPFCEFDAEALPTTFAVWNQLVPCKAGGQDLGDVDLDLDHLSGGVYQRLWEKNGPMGSGYRPNVEETEPRPFDDVPADLQKDAVADVFLFYSQTFSENDVAIHSVDQIIDQFNEPGGWSQCFDNIYAIEANIPQELDLYIPSAQEELYNWVNGPNRQFEAAFRIIQSGEWGDYDGFYLMEGDSIPIKSHWLDVVLSEIEYYRPFAILGAQYDGDKWDQFYEQIPISLLHHTNGNGIYNTSHPLLERLVGQLEVEAPCPYNSIPYDYRMSQMWVEGTLGIVPELAPKIMLNEEGENITLSDNRAQFGKWGDLYAHEEPFRYTKVIHNYAATNLIPRHLGPEYIIHGAKLYSPWDPPRTSITLVVSEWFFDRSHHLLSTLDYKDHPYSEVVVMLPPSVEARDDYDELSVIPIRPQHRSGPDHMDLCEAEINTDWFMMTNAYHHVATHVDLMFTPGKFKPVVPFTPATYPFCFKFAYCKETVTLAQRFAPGHDKVVLDFDMLYHTETRNKFCAEWKEKNGEEGEDLYKHQQRRVLRRKKAGLGKIVGPSGPTGTAYTAYLVREGKDGMYKFTDRSLYGARDAFIKIFAKEEKLDGMSEEELAKRTSLLGGDNATEADCNCAANENEADCINSGMGCQWRPLFESCHPPELIDGDPPICPQTDAPTMAPTVKMDGRMEETEAPTVAPTHAPQEPDPWYASLFKAREHETAVAEEEAARDAELQDDDFVEPVTEPPTTEAPSAAPTEYAMVNRTHSEGNATDATTDSVARNLEKEDGTEDVEGVDAADPNTTEADGKGTEAAPGRKLLAIEDDNLVEEDGRESSLPSPNAAPSRGQRQGQQRQRASGLDLLKKDRQAQKVEEENDSRVWESQMKFQADAARAFSAMTPGR